MWALQGFPEPLTGDSEMLILPADNNPRPRVALRSCLLLALLVPATATAAPVVHPKTQAKNLIRVLTYDRNFRTRFAGGVTIGVLFKESDPASKTLGANIYEALHAMGSGVFPGWATQVVTLSYENVDALASTLYGNNVNVLYVSVGLEAEVERIAEVTRMRNVVTIGATRTSVTGGLSFGIVDANGKSAILVNRSAAHGEGTKFSAQLLRVAEVID